jgi:hypothetical protein
MNTRPIPKAELLALIAEQPEGCSFAYWEGGGLTVRDGTGAYLGYLDLAWRHCFLAAGEGPRTIQGDIGA